MINHQEFEMDMDPLLKLHILPEDMFAGARASARRTAVMRPGWQGMRNCYQPVPCWVRWELAEFSLLQERFGPGGNPKCWDLVGSSSDLILWRGHSGRKYVEIFYNVLFCSLGVHTRPLL